MLFPKVGKLGKMLRCASQLAMCDDFIESYKDGHENLPSKLKVWATEMFCIGIARYYFDPLGEIAHWMINVYPELYNEIIDLSKQLETAVYDKKEITLREVDWDLMINGITRYRQYLIYLPFNHEGCF